MDVLVFTEFSFESASFQVELRRGGVNTQFWIFSGSLSQLKLRKLPNERLLLAYSREAWNFWNGGGLAVLDLSNGALLSDRFVRTGAPSRPRRR